MVHQYKVGDKVRIKEREDYKDSYPFPFVEPIDELAGTICEIISIEPIESFTNPKSKYINDDYHIYTIMPIDSSDHRDFFWDWHSSMFEPVLENPKTNAQTLCSLKEGDLIPICGMVGKIQSNEDYSGYYLDFNSITYDQAHFASCIKLEELISDFKKIANKYGAIQQEDLCFPEFSTISDLVKFAQAVNNAYNSKKSITTSKTLNENEIRFQKPKASSIRGIVPTGRAICGRRRKTAIELGHLSNTTCYC